MGEVAELADNTVSPVKRLDRIALAPADQERAVAEVEMIQQMTDEFLAKITGDRNRIMQD